MDSWPALAVLKAAHRAFHQAPSNRGDKRSDLRVLWRVGAYLLSHYTADIMMNDDRWVNVYSAISHMMDWTNLTEWLCDAQTPTSWLLGAANRRIHPYVKRYLPVFFPSHLKSWLWIFPPSDQYILIWRWCAQRTSVKGKIWCCLHLYFHHSSVFKENKLLPFIVYFRSTVKHQCIMNLYLKGTKTLMETNESGMFLPLMLGDKCCSAQNRQLHWW